MVISTASPSNPQFSLLPKVINGGIAGIVGVTCTFPVDLVKTRLQNQQILPGGEKMYKSILDCGIKTVRHEGFRGMYRGLLVNVIFITPEKAIKLSVNDLLRHNLRKDGRLSLPREMLSGAGAATCQMIVTTPMELLKIQLQDAGRAATKDKAAGVGAAAAGAESLSGGAVVQKKPPAKLSAYKIALQLYREKGILSVYKGIRPTFCRDVIFSSIYFPFFAHLNAHGPRKQGSTEATFWVSLVAGCIAGGTGSFCANPFDVVKTRLQTLKVAKGEKRYKGMIDCFINVYKDEGPRAFFKGGLSRVLVIAPLFGIAQAVYFFGVAEFLLGRPQP